MVAGYTESALEASSPCSRDLEVKSSLLYVEPLTAVQAKAEDGARCLSTGCHRNGGQPDMGVVVG